MPRSAADDVARLVGTVRDTGQDVWALASATEAGEVLDAIMEAVAEAALDAAAQGELPAVGLARWSQHDGFSPSLRLRMARLALDEGAVDPHVRFMAGSTMWLVPDASDRDVAEGMVAMDTAVHELEGTAPEDPTVAAERHRRMVALHREGRVDEALRLVGRTAAT